jgi:Putative beta-barrel porin 2
MKLNWAFLVISLVFAGVVSTVAQPVNVQQFQNNQQQQQFKVPPYGLTTTNAPELYPGETTDVGPQHILRATPRWNYFNVYFDSQVFYSDNANFAQGSSIIASSVFVNTVQAAITPPPITLGQGKLTPTAGVISQWYNYGNNQMASLDFDALTFFISERYNANNWQVSLGANYTRLLDQGDYNWTYEEILPALAVQRFFPIEDKLLVVLGNQVDYHFTDVPSTPGTSTQINNRFDEIVNLGLSWQLTRNLVLQPYGRFQYSLYRHNTLQTSSRTDYLYSTGVALTYYFNRYLSLRTFFNYNFKQTDDAVSPAYHEYNGGIGGTLNFNF